MNVKVSELKGIALDWAVAKCEKYHHSIRLNKYNEWEDLGRNSVGDDEYTYWSPSTNWAQGGPIIERENISLENKHDGWWVSSIKYNYADEPEFIQLDKSPLIAAMRCYVSLKVGYVIDIPDEFFIK